MFRMRRATALLLAGCLLCLAFVFVKPLRAQTRIHVGVPASQTSAIPLHIGISKGIFAKYGLTVEPIVIPSGRVNINALISGGTEFINGSSPELFFVGEQGGDIVGLGSWDDSSPYNLVSREKIQSIKELKGKRLAAGGYLDKSHLFLKLLLAREGLDANKDVELVFIGGSSARLSMLAAGKIDAAPAAPEFAKRAEKLGLWVIPISMPYTKGLITTRKSYVAKNRAGIKSFLTAYAESVRYLVGNKDDSLLIMARVFRLQDKEVLDYAYNALKSHAQPDLYPSEEGIRNVLKTMAYEDPRFAAVPPLKHMDLSLVEELRSARAAQR
jgi:ABC-type nitrate/sulfonate/bicarbonate transport system substrate-binding protein